MTDHRTGLFRNGTTWCSEKDIERLRHEAELGDDQEAREALSRAKSRSGRLVMSLDQAYQRIQIAMREHPRLRFNVAHKTLWNAPKPDLVLMVSIWDPTASSYFKIWIYERQNGVELFIEDFIARSFGSIQTSSVRKLDTWLKKKLQEIEHMSSALSGQRQRSQ